MYGLQSNTDLSFFGGAVLSQICVGQNEIQFYFDQGAGVNAEGGVSVSGADGRDSGVLVNSVETGQVALSLLGALVLAADVEEGGVLAVEFEGGRRLRVHDTNAHYESYQISFGDLLYVV